MGTVCLYSALAPVHFNFFFFKFIAKVGKEAADKASQGQGNLRRRRDIFVLFSFVFV